MSDRVDILLMTTPRPPHLSPAAVQVSENSAPPLGLLSVAAALEEAGFRVVVHDFYQLGGKPADVTDLINEYRPRVVGVSTLTSGVHLAYRLCTHVKRVDQQIVTVFGGPHATALPEEVVAHPEVELQDGPEPHLYKARLLEGEERADWWEHAVATWPTYASYQARTDREIPLFLLERA